MSSPQKKLGKAPVWASSKNVLRNNMGWASISIFAVIIGLSALWGTPGALPWPWAVAGVILGSGTTYWYLSVLRPEKQLPPQISDDDFLAARQFFDQYLTQRMLERQNMALLFCTIDFFRQFIETYGLSSGEVCLGRLHESLQKSVRKGDLVTRMGTETFVVFLPNTDEHIAIQIAERVRSQIEQLNIPHDTSAISQVVTISGGLAFCNSDDTLTSTEFLEAATHLHSISKRRGRNQITNRLQGIFADLPPEPKSLDES